MFPFSSPLDYSHSQASPFSLYPSSSLSSNNTYLPPAYTTYDEERSRIEQALLARKQQQRRQAEAAAFLAEQRQRERQAAIEEAIREERERRAYERALRYREEMVRKAREEEEAKQRYIQAMRVQEDTARMQQLEEQQEQMRRRRNEQAEQQQSSLDAMPDLFQLLFGSQLLRTEAPQPAEPVTTPRPSIPSPNPRAESSRQGESSKLDLPSFLEAIFGPPRPLTTTQAPTQQSPAPASQRSPSPLAQPSSSPSPAPVTSAEPQATTPAVDSKAPADAPSSDEEEEAAAKLQRHFRRHLARRNALDKISSLSSSFVDRQSTFEKPSSFTFKSSPDSTSSTTTPRPLAFVSSNSPFLAYEDYLVDLLSKIDAVESGGDRQVKKERKSLVRKVEKELSRLDAMKERAWEEHLNAANSVQVDQKEVVHEQAGNEQGKSNSLSFPPLSQCLISVLSLSPDPPAASTTPTPSSESLNDDDDESLTPLLPLTRDAVSSLPTSTPLSHSRSPSDSGSSTTSSTLTVSSASSQVDQYISEMLRRAQKLGKDVEKMEIDEKTKPVEIALTV